MANAATKRLALIGGAVAVVGVGVYLMLSAFNDNLVFFYSPMQVAAKEAPQGRTFRMGGMVEEGSVKRLPDGVTVTFGITDTAAVIPTEYKGILPDLFKEGKGVVARANLMIAVCLWQAKCLPSMMKTTCRPKRRKPWIKHMPP